MIKYLSPFKAQALGEDGAQAYIVPSSTIAQIRALTFHNTTADPVQVEVYLISSNVETVEMAQRLLCKSIKKNESYLCPEVINHVLTSGMRVFLKGKGANVMVSVAEQTA